MFRRKSYLFGLVFGSRFGPQKGPLGPDIEGQMPSATGVGSNMPHTSLAK